PLATAPTSRHHRVCVRPLGPQATWRLRANLPHMATWPTNSPHTGVVLVGASSVGDPRRSLVAAWL
ncbi:hypothetical protein B296_00036483, partial [Ensete ventricosum]